jgi:hypothetical protein
MNNTVYWTMKNGQKISVDDMDIQHLRNTLKMIIRNIEKAKSKKSQAKFEIHGEIAQDIIAQGMMDELCDDETYEMFAGFR